MEGVVEENVLDCKRDLSCYLRLQTEEGEVTVLYAEPFGTPCPNHPAGSVGIKIREGARVRVFARAIGGAELSTCPDEKYFLLVLDDP